MTWKESLRELVAKKDWRTAMEYILQIVNSKEYDDTPDAYLNALYVFEAIPMQPDVNGFDVVSITAQKEIYDVYIEGKSIFYANADFLFWSGWLATWCEWLFKMELEEARMQMLNAYNLCPENKLFALGLISGIDSNADIAYKECIRTIMSDNATVSYIRDKGVVGDYMLMIFEGVITE